MFDPRAFEGTAQHYAAGRPPYSPRLPELLADELELDGRGLLIDVGCGPGVLVLVLRHLFEDCVAVDPEPGMLEEGARRARAGGLPDVRWLCDRAENLGSLGLPPSRLVTFGQSFHRVDRIPVANAVHEALEPGGSLALVSHVVEGRPRPPNPGYPEIPHAAIQALIVQHLGTPTRDYLARWAEQPRDTFASSLAQTRFGSSRSVYAIGIPDLLRTTDQVVANYFSMSYAAPRYFGDGVAAYEADLRALLRSYSPEGLFWDWPGDTEVVLATKRERPPR